MKITVCLDADFLAEAKKYASETDCTISVLVEHALREMLGRRGSRGRGERIHLKTVGGGGLLPGVTLDRNAAVLQLLDGRK